VVGALGGTASSFVALGQDVSKLHEKARTCEQRFARIESQNLATHAAVDELLRAVGRLEGQSRE
jgi:enoyl reductase-like protein